MEEESKNKRFPIEEEDIAEVVCMMTGIPVKRMVQAETEKLRRMGEDLRGAGWASRIPSIKWSKPSSVTA